MAIDVQTSDRAITFKENKGQIGDQFSKPRPDILFSGQTQNLNFYLRNNGISYQLYRADEWKETNDLMFSKKDLPKKVVSKSTIYRLDINWIRSNTDFKIIKEGPLTGVENYYNEVCPKGVIGVRSYKKLKYKNIYSGIDLTCYESNGNFKYDYDVLPGADHKQIQFEILGADTILIDKNGNLIIKTPLGSITEEAPIAFQEGKRVEAKWQLLKNVVSFFVPKYDKSKTLVIDPLVRLWGTYFGDSKTDWFYGSCTDLSANLYVTGGTDSPSNIATVGAHQISYGGFAPGSNWFAGDAILAKYNANGNKIWCTYYGGDHGDFGLGCAVNANGNYVAMVGVTASTLAGVIATPGCHQSIWYGGQSPDVYDGFCALFDSSGVRKWGTYYGGAGGDQIYNCCFDPNDNLFFCGGSYSSNTGNLIATNGAFQTVFGGNTDAFLAKFDINGNRIWSTYYGSAGYDYAEGCVYDKSGFVYIVGTTSSSLNISTSGCQQPTYGGGVDPLTMGGFKQIGDALIVKFDDSGNRIWSTYYGHGNNDWANSCNVDSKGDLIVSGATAYGIPGVISTPGSFQSNYGGGARDAFLLKLNSNGVRQWCTFYGGTGIEPSNYCAVDANDDIYLCGYSNSTSSLTTPCSYQPVYGGGTYDIFLAKFSNAGMRQWGTYYGSTSSEDFALCKTDVNGNVFIVGETYGAGAGYFGSVNANQPNFGGGPYDGIIAKFNGCEAPELSNPASELLVCAGRSVTLQTQHHCGITWLNSMNETIATGSIAVITPSVNQSYVINDSTCGKQFTTEVTVTVSPFPNLTVSSNTILCVNADLQLKATGADTYSWEPNSAITCTDCAEPIVSPKEDIQYCVTGAINSCETKSCTTVSVNLVSSKIFTLPNAFTPNNDGYNDAFCLQGWDKCNDSFAIKIFSRWGEKVYESTDPNFCWNGFYNGHLLSGDVYIYTLTATYKDGTSVERKGNITLIR
jgi:gliding motility-associated-like protein